MSKSAEHTGLYDPAYDHDSCGVGLIAHLRGVADHAIVADGLRILCNMSHRGAVGADPDEGDGSGITLQLPDVFLRGAVDFALPPADEYVLGQLFLPPSGSEVMRGLVEKRARAAGLPVIGWRQVPTRPGCLSENETEVPEIWQVFLTAQPPEKGVNPATRDWGVSPTPLDLPKKPRRFAATPFSGGCTARLLILRRQCERAARELPSGEDFHFCSLSTRIVVYKGRLQAGHLEQFYPDLSAPDLVSGFALVHQRFSTNTFPAWRRAHPFRLIAHNGEINTVRGNRNWLRARSQALVSDRFGADLQNLWPLLDDDEADSASFDQNLELLVAGGYSLAHALLLMIPEAWQRHTLMPEALREFYAYHAALMEPWDGPAAIVATDGLQIAALLDRNGLRPARYLLTDDERLVLASEAGVLDLPPHKILRQTRLEPGRMLLLDFAAGKIIDDAEIKAELAGLHDYAKLRTSTQFGLDHLADAKAPATPDPAALTRRQTAFGYTRETLEYLLAPALERGEEALGSMGNDTPPAVLSQHGKPLANYFKQNFAQVTNPAIDPLREELVMSLHSLPGARPQLFALIDGHTPEGRCLSLESPLLTNPQLAQIRAAAPPQSALSVTCLDMVYPADQGASGMQGALDALCAAAQQAVSSGQADLIILSDRNCDAEHIAIPALLACSAVHHHLITHSLRTRTGLIVETAACIEVHHLATLAGFGAEAINPYLALDSLNALPDAPEDAEVLYLQALAKGLKKVMSKMGISTYQSYCGAQQFDAVGLSEALVAQYFPGTATPVGGVGLAELAEEACRAHREAFGTKEPPPLPEGGDYHLRGSGEAHAWTAASVTHLQHAVRADDAAEFAAFTRLLDKPEEPLNLRGLFELKPAAKPLPLDEVEPAAEIMRRFSTGAMSFGSLSHAAHVNLARAMNRVGGKSNTGEGGEEAARYLPLNDGAPNPDRSAIKQVASGRFGVTTEYLVNADVLQIKIAQGAKPGEGGQLPGYKVDRRIAAVRHSTPGVGLISPPPHHDIYSIEDLAQLIFDLKNVNPAADISVKLVAEIGVGTVAAGVAKAHADHITIAGFDGGTGASPLTSIKHAGLPWEVGLAETQQTLVANRLRGRVALQVDGGLRTGRDVVVGALLGADEFGFATAPLIAQGCLMTRKCHLNVCPVGIATQDPQLIARFPGKPEHVVRFFAFIAEQVRVLMAELGAATLDELIGRAADYIDFRPATEHWKAHGLDYHRLLHPTPAPPEVARFHSESQQHGLESVRDHWLIEQAAPALERRESVVIETLIRNTDRTFAGMLAGELTRLHGASGLPEDTIRISANGAAGQSFGAWLAPGISLTLAGVANDYLGKGLCGGRIVVHPPKGHRLGEPEDNCLIGNTALYGATAGECYCLGAVGERFAVRNSGAIAVIEGAGDHACEYMTGGVVLCLGRTGRNFAAGMSGGVAYVWDPHGTFEARCNTEMISLQPLAPDADADMNDARYNDHARVRGLLAEHARLTGSERAAHLLEDWQTAAGQFIKLMPGDYERALAALYDVQDTQAAHG